MATADTPVRLEVRLPGSRPTFIEVTAAEFLIGSVAGCDLVVPGGDLPPVLGVIVRNADSVKLRKLAPNFKLYVNKKPVQHAPLTHGDSITIGVAEIVVHVPAAAVAAMPVAMSAVSAGAGSAAKPWSFTIPMGEAKLPPPAREETDTSGALRQMQQENERLKQQAREIENRKQALDDEEQNRRLTWAERESQLEAELDSARERKRTVEETGRQQLSAREIELDQKLRNVAEREKQLLIERTALDTEVRTHREDMVRLERTRAMIETNSEEMTRREQAIERDMPVLDARGRELDQLEIRLRGESEDVRQARVGIETIRNQLAQRTSEIERQELMLKSQEARLDRGREDVCRLSQELNDQKVRQEARDRELIGRQQLAESRHAELALREETVTRTQTLLEERDAAIHRAAQQLQDVGRELSAQEVELKGREERLTIERTKLDESVRTHREDLLRLDRFRESLEIREKQIAERSLAIDEKVQQFERDTRALEEKAGQVAIHEQRLRDEEVRIQQLHTELDNNASDLANRSATTDGHQTVLVAVRAKLERLREELRVEAQTLADERGRHEMLEQALAERQRQIDDRAAALHATTEAQTAARHDLDERTIAIERAAADLAQQRQLHAAAEAALAERLSNAEHSLSSHTEQATLLRDKAALLLDLQQKIEADRATISDREGAVKAAEITRQELQEQLLQRAEELAAKHRAADDLAMQLSDRAAAIDRDRHQVDADLGMTRQDLDQRAAELQQVAIQLREREANCYRLAEKLKGAGRTLAEERKSQFEARGKWAEERGKWEEEQRTAAEDLARTRAELAKFKAEAQAQAVAIVQALPDLESRGSAALDRLAQAREQLRHHVAELHTYAKQSYEDLEGLRQQVTAETERLREQQTALTKARGEHRHAVTAFRQQLIDWQGRITEMKSAMLQGGGGLQQKAGDLDSATQEVEQAGQQLVQQAAVLEQQEEQVAQQHDVVEYHLADMRDWFRHKLKDLAETSIVPAAAADDAADEAQILPITNDLDPGDKKLGELLTALDLVDNVTLTALLLEARRQRRSLRQVLLASGKLTVYQMALIEAGKIDGLTIGPLGVVDRLLVNANEAVYRVIDPRQGSTIGPAVLRHLTEAANADAAMVEEFRAKFGALVSLRHPHVAATIETLDLLGRPAALQEWLTGLPSPEWPSLAAAPGVWYRLTCQSLLGLATAHQAGLVHGAIGPQSMVLTSDGLVKLAGVGEPSWLTGGNPNATAADDVVALGHLANSWAALTPKRKLAKTPKPLPSTLREVLDQWVAGGYATAVDVLEALDQAGSNVPAGAETWERLMKYAGANATDGVAWRKAA